MVVVGESQHVVVTGVIAVDDRGRVLRSVRLGRVGVEVAFVMRGVPVDVLVGIEHNGLLLRVGPTREAQGDPSRNEYDLSKKYVSVDESRHGEGNKREIH